MYSVNTFRGPKVTFLEVAYHDRKVVKELGAQWDYANKKWFVSHDVELGAFKKWIKKDIDVRRNSAQYDQYIYNRSDGKDKSAKDISRMYLLVPFDDFDQVAKMGAKWDVHEGRWFVPPDMPPGQFDKWKQKNEMREGDSDEVIDRGGGASRPPSQSDNPITNTNSHMTPNRLSKVVIFDIETTGLPQKGKLGKRHDFRDLSSYDTCRVVQMCCMLCDRETLQTIDTYEVIIKADGFVITNSAFHGVSQEMSLREGVPFSFAMERLLDMFQQSSVLIAHNAVFDVNVLKSEMCRHNFDTLVAEVDKLEVFCSMMRTKSIVNARNKLGRVKNPNLKELYSFAVGQEIENHHDARFDVINLQKALKSLSDTGILRI